MMSPTDHNSKKKQGVKMEEWKDLAIYSFYPNNDDKMMNFEVKRTRSKSKSKSNSKIHHGKTIYVDESGCLVPRGLRYDGRAFTITSCFRTRRILPGTLNNYDRFNKRIVMNTKDFGFIEFDVKNVEDAKAIEFILINFNNEIMNN